MTILHVIMHKVMLILLVRMHMAVLQEPMFYAFSCLKPYNFTVTGFNFFKCIQKTKFVLSLISIGEIKV